MDKNPDKKDFSKPRKRGSAIDLEEEIEKR